MWFPAQVRDHVCGVFTGTFSFVKDCRKDNFEGTEDCSNVCSNTWSPTSRQLAHQWITQCLTGHTKCNEGIEKGWLPTRLLDIRLRDGSDSSIYLVETTDLAQKPQYITLSHCWGRNPVLSLSTESIAYFKNGCTVGNLPRTYQHTVEVARYFGIEYLWIDSLCIIQDSHKDWERECIRMRDVYQNAFCNIAATGSRDSHTGLFFERDPSLIPVGKIRALWDGSLPQGDFYLYPQKIWATGVSSAPLNRRAWVVQERLLARRVLHFGSRSLFFECCEHEACETFPRGLPPAPHRGSMNQFKRIYTIKNGFTNGLRDLEAYRRWNAVVSAFMNSELTNPSDKAISIAGIAEEFQLHVIKEPYIAGMWRSILTEELLWVVVGEQQASGRPSLRPNRYRAPSWSWLSIDAKISLPLPTSQLRLSNRMEILDIHIDLVDTNHPTGKIKGGHIVVRSNPLIPTTHGVNASKDPDVPKNYLLFGGQKIGTTVIFFDEAAKKPAPEDTMFCLPVAWDPSSFHYFGLLLMPAGTGGAEYHRIGGYKAADKELWDLLGRVSEDSRTVFKLV